MPLTAGSVIMQSASLQSAAPQSSHIGFGAGFVDEYQAFNGQLFLELFPMGSLGYQISAILFAGP
jgi:hypothetical protein